jgi:DNA-binding response OmpR family regulator
MADETTKPLPNALVVDDEQEVADAYALRLRGLCDVDTVYDGRDALSAVANDAVDVMLLDRHMPGMSGDDVLSELDTDEFYGRVIMVTAIDPGFDVLDMPFDDYLCKPIEREDIRAAVNQQCTILGYETLGEYFSLEAKRNVIEAELPGNQREDHEEYQRMSNRGQRLEQRASRLLDDFETMVENFDAIGREGR